MDRNVSELLETMRTLICSDTGDIDLRDDADREFRRLYLRVMEMSDAIPFGVREEVRHALLALVGDDDWATACARLQGALRALSAEAH
jgi:hypothetical protein